MNNILDSVGLYKKLSLIFSMSAWIKEFSTLNSFCHVEQFLIMTANYTSGTFRFLIKLYRDFSQKGPLNNGGWTWKRVTKLMHSSITMIDKDSVRGQDGLKLRLSVFKVTFYNWIICLSPQHQEENLIDGRSN